MVHRKATFILLDQVFFSGGSAALSLVVARLLNSPPEYGRFGVIVLIGVVCQGVIRAAGLYEIVRASSRETLGSCEAATRLLSVALGLVAVAAAWVELRSLADALISGLGIGLIGMHESKRLLALHGGWSRRALLSELAWLTPVVGLILSGSMASLRVCLVAYAACGGMGLMALIGAPRQGRLIAGIQSLRRRLRVFLLTSLEQSLGALGGLALVAVIAWRASAATSGEVRIAVVLMGPAAVVVQGLANAVAMHGSHRPGVAPSVLKSMVVTFVTFLAIGGVTLIAPVRATLRMILGGSFSLDYLTPVAILSGGEAMLILLASWSRSQGSVLMALNLRGASALGAAAAGVAGSASGILVSGLAMTVTSACVCLVLLRAHPVGAHRLDLGVSGVTGVAVADLRRRLEQEIDSENEAV